MRVCSEKESISSLEISNLLRWFLFYVYYDGCSVRVGSTDGLKRGEKRQVSGGQKSRRILDTV